MKNLTFDGRLGKDAEVGATRGTGKPYVRFSVANNSFNNGKEKTDWIDVTSYDPYVVENRVKYLTKGTYVIITGSLNTEAAVRDGKLWINNYVTAYSIDTPNFGKKDDANQGGQQLSTYTGGTPSVVSENAPLNATQAAQVATQPTYSAKVEDAPLSTGTIGGSYTPASEDDGGLPF